MRDSQTVHNDNNNNGSRGITDIQKELTLYMNHLLAKCFMFIIVFHFQNIPTFPHSADNLTD